MDQWSQYQNLPHENVNWAELAQRWMAMKAQEENEHTAYRGALAPCEPPPPSGPGPGKSLFPSVSTEDVAPPPMPQGYSGGYEASWDTGGHNHHGRPVPPPPPSGPGSYRHNGYGHDSHNWNERRGPEEWDEEADYGQYGMNEWHQPGPYDDRPVSYAQEEDPRSTSPQGPMGALPMWPPPDWAPPSYGAPQPPPQQHPNRPRGSHPLPPPPLNRGGPGPRPPPHPHFPPYQPPPLGFHGGPIPSSMPLRPGEMPMFSNMSAEQRKKLPAWILEGLDKAEKDRQKQAEREVRIKRVEEERARRRALAGKGKFDSSSDEEDNDEADRSSNENAEHNPALSLSSLDNEPIFLARRAKDLERGDENGSVEDNRNDEQKRDDALAAMRVIMTTILLEVTDAELKGFCDDALYAAKRKAEPKLLAKSSALAALTSFGDDDESDSETDSGDNASGKSSPARSTEETAFKAPLGLPPRKLSKHPESNINPMEVRENESSSSTDDGNSSLSHSTIEKSSPSKKKRDRSRSPENDNEEKEKKHSKSDAKEKRHEKKSSDSDDSEKSERERKKKKHKRSSRSRSKERGDRRKRSRSRDRRRSRSRSRERRRSRSRDKERRERRRSRSRSRDRRSRSRERRDRRRSRSRDRKHSR